ncbi:hypothetical protein BGW38_007590, partial [Lunasporangiospora selenospora]
ECNLGGPRTLLAREQLPTESSWLGWLAQTAAVTSADCVARRNSSSSSSDSGSVGAVPEPIVLAGHAVSEKGAIRPVARSPHQVTVCMHEHLLWDHGHGHGRSKQAQLFGAPGIRSYRQGTEDAGCTGPLDDSTRSTTPADPGAPTSLSGAKGHLNHHGDHSRSSSAVPTSATTAGNHNNSNNNNSKPIPEHRSDGAAPITSTSSPSTSSSSSPSVANPLSKWIATFYRDRYNSRIESNSGRPTSPNSSAPTPSSKLEPSSSTPVSSGFLLSTRQEVHQAWDQTSAFLYRTFSPTYRVGLMYIDSWSNGTQVRGLERLRVSLQRGDALILVRNTTVRLTELFHRSLTAARGQQGAIENEDQNQMDDRRGSGKGNGGTAGEGGDGGEGSGGDSSGGSSTRASGTTGDVGKNGHGDNGAKGKGG